MLGGNVAALSKLSPSDDAAKPDVAMALRFLTAPYDFESGDSYKFTHIVFGLSRFDITMRSVLNCWFILWRLVWTG
jgi:hypothetical protein